MNKDKNNKSFKSFKDLGKNLGNEKSKKEETIIEQGQLKNMDKNLNQKQITETSSKNSYFFPKYLHQIYEKEQIDNYSLYLNKYVIRNSEKSELKLKIDNLQNITFSKERFELVKNFITMHKQKINNLKSVYLIESKLFKPEYKLIIGLGSPSVYEISLTLNHIYGIPYIPGQTIKGVLRNYVINKFFDLSEKDRLNIAKKVLNKELMDFEDLKKEQKQRVYKEIAKEKESKALENELFKFIFGSQNNQGNIIFFDTFPDGEIKIDIDIINNHFPEYYEDKEGKVPPADWQNPRPIKFLVVKDTPFNFFIGIKKGINYPDGLEKFGNKKSITTKEELLNYVFNLLKEALEFNGIGAKTSIGYGYLSLNQEEN